MEAIKEEALSTLKILLGIEDDSKDTLLFFLIDDVVNMILGYCRIEVLPRQLESLVPMIASDMYRAKGYGREAAPEVVKSVSEGENSVSFDTVSPKDDYLTNYYKRLNPFRNRRGFTPSDFDRRNDNEQSV